VVDLPRHEGRADGRFRLQGGDQRVLEIFLFDAEQHNPRMHPGCSTATRGSGIRLDGQPRPGNVVDVSGDLPSLPDGTLLLLDEPEMALSGSTNGASEDDDGVG
jgi:hypothetical protein